ncbi:MAG: hypothetical protein HY905_01525 [Deltaproteobacteria bacterium]|nr:hypothetical protein [Deltaproteobacteria bacterium]
MKRAVRFRLRWLGWLLLAAVPFLSPSPSPRLPLGTFADEPAPIVARLATPAATTTGAGSPGAAPGALDGLGSLSTPRFVLRFGRGLDEQARVLAAKAEKDLDDLQRLLGPAPGPTVELRLVANAREMARVSPPDDPPPSWATGVTYGGRSLILLSALSPRSGRFVPLPAVMRHELAHLVTDRIVKGHPLPRWLDEGIALWAAGDDYAGRSEELLDAALRDKLLPLERISRGYPADPDLVPLAYAQSVDIVMYLTDTYGRAPLRRLLREVGEGKGFREAVLDTYGTSVARLEDDWREGIRVWYRWVPALVSGTTLWALISFLLAWAYLKQRQRRRELYARWDREEEAAERAARPAPRWPDPDPKPHGGIRLPLSAEPKGKAPLVFHDGRYHTLH